MLGNLFGKSKSQQPPTNEMEAFYLQQFMSSNKNNSSGPQPLNAQNPFMQMPQDVNSQSYDQQTMTQNIQRPQSKPYPTQNFGSQPFNATPVYPQSFDFNSLHPNGMYPPQQLPPQMPQQARPMPPFNYNVPTGMPSQAAPFMTPPTDPSQTLYPDLATPGMPQLLPTDFSGMALGANQQSFEPSLSQSPTPNSSPTATKPTLSPNHTTYMERQLEQHEQRLEHLHDRLKTIETYLQLIPPK